MWAAAINPLTSDPVLTARSARHSAVIVAAQIGPAGAPPLELGQVAVHLAKHGARGQRDVAAQLGQLPARAEEAGRAIDEHVGLRQRPRAARQGRHRRPLGDDCLATAGQRGPVARRRQRRDPLLEVGAQSLDPVEVQLDVAAQPVEDLAQRGQVVGARGEGDHLGAKAAQLPSDCIDGGLDRLEQGEDPTRIVGAGLPCPVAVAQAASLAEEPEHVGEQIAPVAHPALDPRAGSRLEPLQQRGRVVAQAIAKAVAAVVAIGAQLERLGGALDRAPVDQLFHVAGELDRPVVAVGQLRGQDPAQQVVVQRLDLVVAAEQRKPEQDR